MNKYQEALNKIKNKLTTVEYLQPLQATNKPTTFQEAFERAEGIEMTIECEEELKTLQELVDQNKEYTLEEVKKMWEEDGWKVSEDGYFNAITFMTDEKGIEFDIEDKTYFTFQKELDHNSFYIDYKLHDLITKTIKVLEKENKHDNS